jgi:hypothetical protein
LYVSCLVPSDRVIVEMAPVTPAPSIPGVPDVSRDTNCRAHAAAHAVVDDESRL